ncbi:MAG TPA: hypothetical protein VKY37_08065 [Brumimicrobium sp.]|nr:hypothetical protein [Brumimicrobium sp.]
MIKSKTMKFGLINAFILIFISSILSCDSAHKKEREVCECFEVRLEIKKMIESADDDFGLVESERYKVLSAKKEECFNSIEPQYFEEKEAFRNGKNEKEFLLEELSDCEAVKELLGVDNKDIL